MGQSVICYLIRHGKDDDTVRGGWSNSGLTEEGSLQVKKLVNYIKENKNELKVKRLFSSDLPRAVETITPISAVLNLKVEFKPEFRETNNGVFAGMPNDIANEKYPGLFWNTLEWDEAYPQGESPHIFYERIKTAWKKFSEIILKDNKNIILVTHGGVINVIYSIIDGISYSNKELHERIPHATIIPLIYDNEIWKKGD
ncbi:MAG: phosphoglycerate mutase family protein [Oscillospiraceae bacterium]|nr:phosphoglycerate mutase family protein [Oscillospiraceae bacterium]